MKAQIKFEWRQLEEPEPIQDAAWVIKTALQQAGYCVTSFPEVQGVWDEDKPKYAGGPWGENRLPHEMVVTDDTERMIK